MVSLQDFIKDSLFCEYGYIINMDTKKLEMYEGFQKKPDKRKSNRYGTENERGYYPCRMVKAFPLDKIPDDWMAKAFPRDEDEDDS